MSNPQMQVSPENDHDLLIRIDTKLDIWIKDQDDIKRRIRSLEVWRTATAGALFLLNILIGLSVLDLSRFIH